MIIIANKIHYKHGGVYIGRPSIYGNPYSHKEGTLAKFKVSTHTESVESYRPYFYEQLGNNRAFIDAINSLIFKYKKERKLVLVCWCFPLACHGDIIKEYIEAVS